MHVSDVPTVDICIKREITNCQHFQKNLAYRNIFLWKRFLFEFKLDQRKLFIFLFYTTCIYIDKQNEENCNISKYLS